MKFPVILIRIFKSIFPDKNLKAPIKSLKIEPEKLDCSPIRDIHQRWNRLLREISVIENTKKIHELDMDWLDKTDNE